MRVTEKGQVTIPVSLRKRYGLHPNVQVEFLAEAEGIRIQKLRSGSSNPFRALRGVVKKRLAVDRYIEEIRGR
ncbi:MAG: AbrB/MazE/SpoVT family DNA-binding domain-containing protein [Nitrospira sp. SB0677_bin_15]|nr:AbrB/MazE/SpoVT family DNA-binding domain-containing protein [Nitrospira sp. SB0667_bin_9]MYD30071.1 AbrB/MazE/SpoVT family DNA-binding domain-containing protein [Nitrospira sp. SB0661_bin_20]MYG40540.1 AbrB/MazE/SpoVT family DNA-binding domain-containing protein [Nitrospira sp. SB0677_bin_15]MYJ22426.1 AbrB/MazE/SpoVT family DNA-binding domain-containing protein [Nitrospira sp. SB0673_bin_12]